MGKQEKIRYNPSVEPNIKTKTEPYYADYEYSYVN